MLKQTKNNAEKKVEEVGTVGAVEMNAVEEEKTPKYIAKKDISKYVGQTVWYDVRLTLVTSRRKEDMLPLGRRTIRAIDQSNGHILYAEGGFDRMDDYVSYFVYWAEEPTDEERLADIL